MNIPVSSAPGASDDEPNPEPVDLPPGPDWGQQPMWRELIDMVKPAFYDDRWGPWVKLVLTGLLIFAGHVILRLLPAAQ